MPCKKVKVRLKAPDGITDIHKQLENNRFSATFNQPDQRDKYCS
jgi:hypothetical protein